MPILDNPNLVFPIAYEIRRAGSSGPHLELLCKNADAMASAARIIAPEGLEVWRQDRLVGCVKMERAIRLPAMETNRDNCLEEAEPRHK